MRIFYQPTTDPAFNLACEEYLLHHTEDEVLMLWQNAPSIIIGKNQNTVAEINRDFVTDHRIPVIRRLTGGGAVYHDLGNLNYTFIKRHSRDAFNDYRTFAAPVIDLLARFGITATLSGRNDILVDGKKVSGNAQMAHGDSVLHHGTLLFSSDLTMLSQALNVHPLKVKSKGVASVRSRVTNLRKYLPDLAIPELNQALVEAFQEVYGLPAAELQYEDLDQAAIAEGQARFSAPEWIYGDCRPLAVSREARFDWGILRLDHSREDGHIAEAALWSDGLEGDFLSRVPGLLRGCPLEEKALREKLLSDPDSTQEAVEGILSLLLT